MTIMTIIRAKMTMAAADTPPAKAAPPPEQ